MMWHTVASFRRDTDSIRGKRMRRDLIGRVLTFARPYRWMIVGFVFSVVGAAIVGAVPPLLLRRLLDDGLPNGSSPGDLGVVTRLSVLALVVAIAVAVFSLIQRWFSARIGEGLIYDLRVALYDHVQRLPLAFFTRTQTGALMSRLNNDVIGAQQAVTGTLGNVISNVITLVVLLSAMLVLEWRLTVLTLLVVPFFIFPARWVGRRLQIATRESMNLNASMNTTIAERFNVSGALIVKLFGRYPEERDAFSSRARRVADIGVDTAMYMRVLFAALSFIAALGTVIVYYVGGRLAIEDVITAGTVAAFVLYVAQVYQPLTQLTNARVDILTTLVSFERVFEILDFPSIITERPEARPLEAPKGDVVFDHVSFRHPAASQVSLASLEEGVIVPDDETTLILDDVSFRVAPGETVAIVGPSGAGKTTTVMCVPRIHDVTDGTVRIDGNDVRDLTIASLRNAIGVVTQDPHLFHDTIAANLRYAKPDSTDEELVAACTRARIHDLISSLPEGYNTIVGERGYRLSGGEKQRVAIARVLLKNPAIVILDEATSHLDTESEAAIQRALGEALTGRSALVIAHRLSTIISADRIVVLDRGRVVEEGPHDQLLQAGGLYADLYRLQLDQAHVEAAVLADHSDD
jgi:ATP-binding cassette subfamily B protein